MTETKNLSIQMLDSTDEYDTVVLSGGGVRGITHLGVLTALIDRGVISLDKIKVFVGCSIGSFVCLCLCCGYSPFEVFCKIYLIETFAKPPSIADITGMLNSYGLISLDIMKRHLSELMIEKFGRVLSLNELYQKTDKKLFISIVNLTEQKYETFSYLTHPDMLCTDAVIYSSTIPIIFRNEKYNDTIYIDGGLHRNLPLIDGLENGKKKVLALNLMNKAPEITDIISYVMNAGIVSIRLSQEETINEITRNNKDRVTLHNIHSDKTIVISFDMPGESKMAMYTAGIEYVDSYYSSQKEKVE